MVYYNYKTVFRVSQRNVVQLDYYQITLLPDAKPCQSPYIHKHHPAHPQLEASTDDKLPPSHPLAFSPHSSGTTHAFSTAVVPLAVHTSPQQLLPAAGTSDPAAATQFHSAVRRRNLHYHSAPGCSLEVRSHWGCCRSAAVGYLRRSVRSS